MHRAGRVGSLAAAACAAALATRLPAGLPTTAAAITLAAAAITFACLAAEGSRRWAPLALGAGAGLLLLPPDPGAWLPLPAAVAAAPMLLLFHAVLRPHAAAVPRLAGSQPSRLRRTLRLLPWLALASLAVATPWLAPLLLPDRLGASAELQGPAGPLLAALLVAVACVAVALARRAVARGGEA